LLLVAGYWSLVTGFWLLAAGPSGYQVSGKVGRKIEELRNSGIRELKQQNLIYAVNS